MYFSVVHGSPDGLQQGHQEMAQKLKELVPDERLAFCSFLLRELSEK
jgi:hypothetical protein